MPLKHLMYFLASINGKYFWNIPEEKYFAPLTILNLFIKSFDNPFVNIALTFSDSSLNWFSTSTCFALSEIMFLSKFFSLLSKSVFFYEITIIIFSC